MTTDAIAPALSIGDVAAETGLSVHALRFYEQEDLMVAPIHRTSGGRRIYTTADVQWLRMCVNLRKSGMPLSDLRRYAELVREGSGNEAERLRILTDHQARIEEQMAALQGSLATIHWKIDNYAELIGTETTGRRHPHPPAAGVC